MTFSSLNIGDSVYILIFSIITMIYCGWRIYVAWRKPHAHRKYMEMYSTFFSNWPLGGSKYWESKFNFWFIRFLFMFGFLLGAGLLVALMVGLIP